MPAKYSADFALTVTLPSKARRYDAETQYRMYVDKLKALMVHCKHTTVVELTKNYDIHFHSIFKIDLSKILHKTVDRYIKDIFRSEFGFTVVKQVENFNIWIDYLRKDLHETNKVVFPIVKDDYNIVGGDVYPWPCAQSDEE